LNEIHNLNSLVALPAFMQRITFTEILNLRTSFSALGKNPMSFT
jgi:hypothetical protein